MSKSLKILFWASVVLLFPSCWQKDQWVTQLDILAPLQSAPQQTAVREAPFAVTVADQRYEVAPQYRYDLYGLVVSYRHHDGDFMLHRLWGDHLNVADVCVLWGRNTTDLELSKVAFRNGEFTCFFETRDQATWQRFDITGIGNNHLITDSPALRAAIGNVRVGDQIHITGWLANYRNDHGFFRGTSTTREDTGNGACETIYVQSFSVLQSMANPWRLVYPTALFASVLSALLWVAGVATGRF